MPLGHSDPRCPDSRRPSRVAWSGPHVQHLRSAAPPSGAPRPRRMSFAEAAGSADTCVTSAAAGAHLVTPKVRRNRLTARKRSALVALALLIASLALVAAGCGGDDNGGAEVTALPSSSCTGIEYEGEGDPDYLIASDLPLQGSSRTQTE